MKLGEKPLPGGEGLGWGSETVGRASALAQYTPLNLTRSTMVAGDSAIELTLGSASLPHPQPLPAGEGGKWY